MFSVFLKYPLHPLRKDQFVVFPDTQGYNKLFDLSFNFSTDYVTYKVWVEAQGPFLNY